MIPANRDAIGRLIQEDPVAHAIFSALRQGFIDTVRDGRPLEDFFVSATAYMIAQHQPEAAKLNWPRLDYESLLGEMPAPPDAVLAYLQTPEGQERLRQMMEAKPDGIQAGNIIEFKTGGPGPRTPPPPPPGY